MIKSKSTSSSSLNLLLIFLLFFIGTNHLLHFFLNINFFGNLWLTGPLLIILILCISELINNKKSIFEYLLFSSIVFLVLVSSLYQLNYSDGIGLINNRYIITPLITYLLIDYLRNKGLDYQKLFFIVGFAISIVQLSSYVLFPNVQIISAESLSYIDFEGSFSRDGFLGSSNSAYVAAFCNFYVVKNLKNFNLIFFSLVLVSVVAFSDSRNGWVLFGLSYLQYFQRMKLSTSIISLISALVIFSVFFGSIFIENTRFGSASIGDVRATKYMLGITLWTENLSTFLFGADEEAVRTTFVRGYLFSDNSFIQIGLDYGFVGLLAYIAIFLQFYRKYGIRLLSSVMIFLALFITNSCLWDFFIMSAMALTTEKKNE